MGSSTCSRACCTSRSTTVGMPNCRTPFPPGLGICTPRTGAGPYSPLVSLSLSFSLLARTLIHAFSSVTPMPSTPALPWLAHTLLRASRRLASSATFSISSCFKARVPSSAVGTCSATCPAAPLTASLLLPWPTHPFSSQPKLSCSGSPLLAWRFMPFEVSSSLSLLSFGSGLRGQRFAPATTPSADSPGPVRTPRSAHSHRWQVLEPPGIRLSASRQATPNLPRWLPHKFRASESIAPLPSQSRPRIRFLFIVSVVLPPASFPRVLTPQLPSARGSACSAHRGLQPHTP